MDLEAAAMDRPKLGSKMRACGAGADQKALSRDSKD